MNKLITIRPICELLEGFYITIATAWTLGKKEYFSHHQGPKAHLHTKFHDDQAINKKIKTLVTLKR